MVRSAACVGRSTGTAFRPICPRPNNLAANFFNVNSPRGVIFSTPGTGFQVSGATTDAGVGQPAAANFGNIDPSYTNTFSTFSPQRLFTALTSNIVDVNFFVPGTATAALTMGFGAIFSDVDLANTTSITFFDASNQSLGTFFAPQSTAGSGGLSFLGISYAVPTISRVRITAGNAALGAEVLDGSTGISSCSTISSSASRARPARSPSPRPGA